MNTSGKLGGRTFIRLFTTGDALGNCDYMTLVFCRHAFRAENILKMFVSRSAHMRDHTAWRRWEGPACAVTWLDEPEQALVFSHLVLPGLRVVGGVLQLLDHSLSPTGRQRQHAVFETDPSSSRTAPPRGEDEVRVWCG